jgi:hypothetical protein
MCYHSKVHVRVAFHDAHERKELDRHIEHLSIAPMESTHATTFRCAYVLTATLMHIGKQRRQTVESIIEMVKCLSQRSPEVWGWAPGTPLSDGAVARLWTEVLREMPFHASDIVLGEYERFHLPVPKVAVEAEEVGAMDDDRIGGIARSAMLTELSLPHTTFLNVDDESIDVDATMASKAARIFKKRKEAAAKLTEARASAKRAKDAANKASTGNARGQGARQIVSDQGASGTMDPPEAEQEGTPDANRESAGAKEVDGENAGACNDEDAHGPQEDEDEEEEAWDAFAIRGFGSSKEERLYVVWNREDPDALGFCEVSWSDEGTVKNLKDLLPNGAIHADARDDLKFGKDLTGRHVSGHFKSVCGGTIEEDGVVVDYDVECKLHTIQWDGDTNCDIKGAGDLIKHDLMYGSKMMHVKKRRGGWMPSQTTLVKWYLDEDEHEFPPPV